MFHKCLIETFDSRQYLQEITASDSKKPEYQIKLTLYTYLTSLGSYHKILFSNQSNYQKESNILYFALYRLKLQ